jgi:hypothetical protein
MPRATHLVHVGVPWSHLILEIRHGSHDLSLVSIHGVALLGVHTDLGLPFLRNIVDRLGACIVTQ